MRDSPSFNLIERPWILVHRLDGRVDEVSIMGLFESAHESRAIVGEVPTQTFAILRVLLAILHRAVEGPPDAEEWHRLWSAGCLPTEVIAEYLDAFRERFDLLHPRTPFFQLADLETTTNECGLEKIIADVPDNDFYLTTRLKRGIDHMSFAEAARWVVHCHAFDWAGLKSGAVGDSRVSSGTGKAKSGWARAIGGVFAEGADLRETLLLNLIATRIQGDYLRSSADDRPAWERQPSTVQADAMGGRPSGPLDLYTWQSRRIKLVADADLVRGVLITNGDPVEPANRHHMEPMSAWQRRKGARGGAYEPRKHDPERSLWRGLSALLPKVAGQVGGSDPARAVSPAVLGWVNELRGWNYLPDDYSVRTRAISVVSQPDRAAATRDIVDDSLSLSIALIEERNAELAATAVGAVEDAERGAKALGGLAVSLAEAAGERFDSENGRKRRSVVEQRARSTAYSALDRPYRTWISGLGPKTAPLEARRQWHDTAKRIVRDLGRELVEHAGPTTWVGREVKVARGKSEQKRHVSSPEAEIVFLKDIARAFELATWSRGEEVPA